jgi:hypothetical protein
MKVTTSRAPYGSKAHVRRGGARCPEGIVCNTAITTSVLCSLRRCLTPWLRWTSLFCCPRTLLSLREYDAYSWFLERCVTLNSGYGLDHMAMEVRSPAEAKDFSSILCVQTGSEAHPVSCIMGTGVLSPALKRGRGPFPGAKARPGPFPRR